MHQVLQNVKTGDTTLEQVPPPTLQCGGVRVRTAASLISAGTEKMLIDLAQKSYLGKAKARPDLVKQVLQKVRKEGLWNTFQKVTSKMERSMPLGLQFRWHRRPTRYRGGHRVQIPGIEVYS